MRWKLWLARTLTGLGLLLLLLVLVRFYTADWTGFAARTLWDWIPLVSPFLLFVIGYLLNRSDSAQERLTQNKQLEEERRIERERVEEAVVRSYINEINESLLSHRLRTSSPGKEIRRVARALTLTSLREVGAARKATIVRFLYDACLIGHVGEDQRSVGAVVQLCGADLAGVNLTGANLRLADLSGVNLVGADLTGADLTGANLAGANLAEADLTGANLRLINSQYPSPYSWCFPPDLFLYLTCSVEEFAGTNFEGANFEGASLGWANLIRCRFSYCKGLTFNQLDQALSLRGATLPDYVDPDKFGIKFRGIPLRDKNTPEPEP